MSWQIERFLTSTSLIPELTAAERKQIETANAGSTSAANAALAAARQLIASGAIGTADDAYIVRLSGHMNPAHRPTPGMSPDYITLTVQQSSSKVRPVS